MPGYGDLRESSYIVDTVYPKLGKINRQCILTRERNKEWPEISVIQNLHYWGDRQLQFFISGVRQKLLKQWLYQGRRKRKIWNEGRFCPPDLPRMLTQMSWKRPRRFFRFKLNFTLNRGQKATKLFSFIKQRLYISRIGNETLKRFKRLLWISNSGPVLLRAWLRPGKMFLCQRLSEQVHSRSGRELLNVQFSFLEKQSFNYIDRHGISEDFKLEKGPTDKAKEPNPGGSGQQNLGFKKLKNKKTDRTVGLNYFISYGNMELVVKPSPHPTKIHYVRWCSQKKNTFREILL